MPDADFNRSDTVFLHGGIEYFDAPVFFQEVKQGIAQNAISYPMYECYLQEMA